MHRGDDHRGWSDEDTGGGRFTIWKGFRVDGATGQSFCSLRTDGGKKSCSNPRSPMIPPGVEWTRGHHETRREYTWGHVA